MKKVSRKKSDTAVFILAGGLSTRMGRDKALIRFGGETVVERLVRLAHKISPRVFVVVDRAEKLDGLNLGGAIVIEDVIPQCGPLGGIDTALRAGQRGGNTDSSRRRLQRETWNLFLTCDMPLVTAALLRKLLAARSAQWDAAHFLVAGESLAQPFPLLLHRRVARRVAKRIKRGQLSVLALLDSLEVKKVQLTAGQQSCFLNVNTPAMLRRARAAMRERSKTK